MPAPTSDPPLPLLDLGLMETLRKHRSTVESIEGGGGQWRMQLMPRVLLAVSVEGGLSSSFSVVDGQRGEDERERKRGRDTLVL